eukprot:366538-Chlamydomonas_euryale.AAC.2
MRFPAIIACFPGHDAPSSAIDPHAHVDSYTSTLAKVEFTPPHSTPSLLTPAQHLLYVPRRHARRAHFAILRPAARTADARNASLSFAWRGAAAVPSDADQRVRWCCAIPRGNAAQTRRHDPGVGEARGHASGGRGVRGQAPSVGGVRGQASDLGCGGYLMRMWTE